MAGREEAETGALAGADRPADSRAVDVRGVAIGAADGGSMAGDVLAKLEPLPQRKAGGRRKRRRRADDAAVGTAAVDGGASGGAGSPGGTPAGDGAGTSPSKRAPLRFVGERTAAGAAVDFFDRNVVEVKYECEWRSRLPCRPCAHALHACRRHADTIDLDHTADVQLHSWGSTLKECFEQVVIAMFGYMTEMETVEVDERWSREIEATGHDMHSLLFHFLDEFLVQFHTEEFIPKDVKIVDFDLEKWRVRVQAKGEKFSLSKHPQGTEVKAITYSAMQVHDTPDEAGLYHIYCIVDI